MYSLVQADTTEHVNIKIIVSITLHKPKLLAEMHLLLAPYGFLGCIGTFMADSGLKFCSRNSRAIILASIDIFSWAVSPTLKLLLHLATFQDVVDEKTALQ